MKQLNISDNHCNVTPPKGAIILGGHIQAYGIIRQLGEIGIKSVVIDNVFFNIAKYSNIANHLIWFPIALLLAIYWILLKPGNTTSGW